MERLSVAGRARMARCLPSLLALIAIVALFAMSGLSTHSSTAGHSTITWAHVESFVADIPVGRCCADVAEAPNQGTTQVAASHSGGDHELLAALCAFAVFFVLLVVGATHLDPAVRWIRRDVARIIPYTVSAALPTASLSVLCVSRT